MKFSFNNKFLFTSVSCGTSFSNNLNIELSGNHIYKTKKTVTIITRLKDIKALGRQFATSSNSLHGQEIIPPPIDSRKLLPKLFHSDGPQSYSSI